MIEKVKIMYDLMVEKFESSPHGRHQAEAYRKIRALADECDSVAEMTVRLQNEGYNELPGIALMTDKIEAHYKAAEENGLTEHVGIYRTVLDDINKDRDNAYLTGFYDDIRRADQRHATTVERLMVCFNDYLHFKVKSEIPTNVGIGFEEWKKEGLNLKDVIYQKAFREHFACTDEFLDCFVNEYEKFATGQLEGLPNVDSKDVEEAFKALKKEDKRRRSVAKEELLRYQRGTAMSVAPESKEGDYEYIEIIVEK